MTVALWTLMVASNDGFDGRVSNQSEMEDVLGEVVVHPLSSS